MQFIFNTEKEVVTETGRNVTNRLIRGSGLIARTTDAECARTYYHYAADEMGSITHLTDEDGEVLNRYGYDAWGVSTVCEEQVENHFRYTGEQFDAITKQYYLRARFYNPVVARFTQEDTYRGDGLNLYAYCANNPVGYVDPSGHQPQCVKDAAAKYMAEGLGKEDTYRGDGLNLYAYCANNPVGYVDPSGHQPQCVKDAAAKYMAEGLGKEEAYRKAYQNHAKQKLANAASLPVQERIKLEERARRLGLEVDSTWEGGGLPKSIPESRETKACECSFTASAGANQAGGAGKETWSGSRFLCESGEEPGSQNAGCRAEG